jgi:hypothetical protein
LRLSKVITLSIATLTMAGGMTFTASPGYATTGSNSPDRANAASSSSQASPPSDASKLAWMTPEQHATLMVNLAGHSGNAAAVSPGALGVPFLKSAAHPFDPPQNIYYVIYSYSDLRGTYTPVRRGNSVFGYNHYAAQHNLYNANAIHAAFQTHHPDVDHGSHLEYISWLTDTSNGSIKLTVRVVVQAASRTDDGVYFTPDGKNIGVITAFCEGYNLCPAWVNS